MHACLHMPVLQAMLSNAPAVLRGPLVLCVLCVMCATVHCVTERARSDFTFRSC